MAYNISMTSPAEREAIIKRAIDASKKNEDFYYFRSTKTPLPIIRIPIGIPIYRMENFRTFTDQKEYIAIEGVKSDLFIKGQESESIQQIQHNLLNKLARKGKDKSIIPVIDVLRKEKQQEPLLITANGIMVNGNRRLAAMRELYDENSTENDSFQDVTLMVLPADASPEEIIDIEASLQGKPETKLDYDWIGDAQLVKSQLNIHQSYSDVSKRLNRNEKDIKNTIQALAEADLYLKEWVNRPGEYSRVKDDAEQFFKDIPKNLEGKSVQLENVSRYIAWSLFDNRAKLPTRIYDYNAAFGRLAEDVIDRFSNNLGISVEKAIDTSDNNEFDIEIESEENESSYDAIIEVIKDKSNQETIDFLVEATLDAIESAKGQKSGDAALKAVSQANSKLASVDLNKANTSTHVAIKKQLEAIISTSNRLNDALSKLTKS